MRVERLAHNRVSLLIPDVQGAMPIAGKINRKAPPLRRGRAPFMQLVGAARATGIACRTSNDAGRYVCNYVYWRALETAEKPGGPDVVVFIHVPKLHDRARGPANPKRPSLDQLARAAQAMLLVATAAARRR